MIIKCCVFHQIKLCSLLFKILIYGTLLLKGFYVEQEGVKEFLTGQSIRISSSSSCDNLSRMKMEQCYSTVNPYVSLNSGFH
jgi:hypothetical protein